MTPIPEPGHSPISGSVLHFGSLGFTFAIFLSFVYVIRTRNNPFLLFAPLVVFGAFTEELVFEVLFTWSLDLLYLLILVPVAVLDESRFELPRSTIVTYATTVLVFGLAFFLSLRFVGSETPPDAVFMRLFRETVRWLFLLSLPLIIYARLDSRRTWLRLVGLQLSVAGMISAVSLLWLVFTYLGVLPPFLAAVFIEPGGVTLRLTGTFTEPSQFATYLTLSFLLGIGHAIESVRERQFKSPVLLTVIAIAIVFTYSTSAFVMFLGVGTVGGLFVFDVLFRERYTVRDYFVRATIGSVGGTVALILLGLGFNFVLTDVLRSVPNLPGPQLLYANTIGKLVTITDSARWFALLTGLRMWFDNPILGVGLGNHFYLSLHYSPRPLPSGRGPVSTFIGVLATTGIIGFTAFVSYLVEIHRRVRSAFSAGISNDNWATVGVYLSFFGLIIGYAINPNFRTVFNAVFLALALGSVKFQPHSV